MRGRIRRKFRSSADRFARSRSEPARFPGNFVTGGVISRSSVCPWHELRWYGENEGGESAGWPICRSLVKFKWFSSDALPNIEIKNVPELPRKALLRAPSVRFFPPPPSSFSHSFSLYSLSSSRFASLFHGSFTVDEEEKKEERLNLKLLSGLPIALRSLRQLIAPLTLINWISSQRDTGSDGVVKRNGRLSHPLNVLYSACCTRHTATWRKQRSIL